MHSTIRLRVFNAASWLARVKGPDAREVERVHFQRVHVRADVAPVRRRRIAHQGEQLPPGSIRWRKRIAPAAVACNARSRHRLSARARPC